MDISIGAVGAALIAGLVSLFGLIIGKEQKISEFRQSWIDELRKYICLYLMSVNSISDTIRMRTSGNGIDNSALISHYNKLNEASYSIKLRINSNEISSKALLRCMADFETLFKNNSDIIPDKIREIENVFILSATELLKFEWNRVKLGEPVFVITKRIIMFMIFISLSLMIYIGIIAKIDPRKTSQDGNGIHLVIDRDIYS